ncbi:MAG: ASKHA domain-containing protein [Planctomycetota bacterium]|nr:ASKHA domain-containing protein [Planctomycetota bacterium]
MSNKTCIITFEPSGLNVQVPVGTNLLEAAHKAGVYLSSICGGDGCCGKCKLIINQGQIDSRPGTSLTEDEIDQNIVLACRTSAISDITAMVPKTHSLKTGRILTDTNTHRLGELVDQVRAEVFEFDPLVYKLTVTMRLPSVRDNTADLERLYMAVREKINAPVIETGLAVMQKLSKVLTAANYTVAVTIAKHDGVMEIIDVQPAKCSQTSFAVAVDVGTTTVVAHLVDLTNAETIDAEAMYNSQIKFGEDYIHRIIYGEQEDDGFKELQSCIINDINSLIGTIASRRKIDLQDITAVVCSGNTAMIHFLLNLDSKRIRREPYIASAGFIPPIQASQVGIKINNNGLLYCLPSVAAYVGGDIVAGVLSTRIYNKTGVSLFVDLGTNGEVVLGNCDWMVCASSSAGPAFEGSGVKCGMRAQTGAIEELTINSNGDIKFKTIGDVRPVGICGSGLLDTLAELFVNGIIDRTGRFKKNSRWKLTEGGDGLEFELFSPGTDGPGIVITQADISNLIRSKAGVFAAIKVLMKAMETETEDIEMVYLAGGFGNFLNVQQAVIIGMLPDVPAEKIKFVGNTSIAGAKAVLLSKKAHETAEKIAHSMTYFDLMTHPGYMDEFIRASFLPHTDLSLFPSAQCVKTD